MFTNNTHINKLFKPILDLTIKTFIQSRSNRRVRRFKKILFRKLKRVSRDKRSAKHLSSDVRKQKHRVLLTFTKNRLKKTATMRMSRRTSAAPRKEHLPNKATFLQRTPHTHSKQVNGKGSSFIS